MSAASSMNAGADVFRPDILAGRTAFLAGGTSGITLGIAQRFAELGANTFVISRSVDKVEAAVDSLGARSAGLSADVRKYEEVQKAFSECVARFGAVDIVVSGAAGNFFARAANLSPNGFKTVVDIDLIGSFHVLKCAYAHMKRPGGVAINISALHAYQPLMGQVHACAAKAGIDSMMRCLALEWGSEGLRVNSIVPGPIAGTEGMSRLAPTPAAEAMVMRTIPLGRYGTKREIADLAVFLASDAGQYITGSVLVCDGGQSVGVGGIAASMVEKA